MYVSNSRESTVMNEYIQLEDVVFSIPIGSMFSIFTVPTDPIYGIPKQSFFLDKHTLRILQIPSLIPYNMRKLFADL